MTCCKDDHLEVLRNLLEALYYVRSNVDASNHGLIFLLEVDLKNNIRILSLWIVHTVDQGLVHVKDAQLLLVDWVPRRRQINNKMAHFIFFNDSDLVSDHIQSLASLLKVLLLQVLQILSVVLRHFGD